MADAQKTIDLIFNGIDKTGAATMAALDNAKKFTGSLQNVTAPIADFTMGAVKLEAGLLAAGLAMTVFAVKVAGDFDQGFRQISTLFDASEEDLANFRNSVQEYAATSSKSSQDVLASLAAAIGAGVEYQDALALITVSERLAIATKADMVGTTEVLVGTMNAYGMSTKDAGELADLMFQIIKDGKIEMNDLSASLANVTPIAAAAGIGMKEVGAAIAVLTAAGMQPSTAIDALKSAISNIIKPSEQAKKMAAELGIEFDVNALKSKGLAGVLQDVALKTGGSADKMAVLIGDVNGLSAVLTLTGPQATNFGTTIKSMGESAGSVSVAYEKMAGAMENVGQRVTNAFEGMLATIGTPLLNEFGGIADAIAGIFNAIGAGAKSGGLKDLAAYVESVFGDIQKSLETVAKNLPAALASADFSGFKNGIEAVVNALKSLFSGIDITSVDGLKNTIELAGTAFLGLSKYVAGVIEVFKPLFDTLVSVGQGAKGVDLSILELAGNLGGIATQLNIVLPLFTGLLTIMTAKQAFGLVDSLKSLTPAIGALTAGPGSVVALGAAFALAGVSVGTTLNPYIDAFVSKLSGSETTLGGWIYDLVNGAEEVEKLGTSTAGAAVSVGKIGDEFVKTKMTHAEAQKAMREIDATFEKTAVSATKLAKSTDDVNTYAMKTVPIIDAATGKITGYEQQLVKSAEGTIKLGSASDKAGTGLTKIATETDKAKEATRKWNEEIAKMAFEEKIAQIESATKITTARIEADAKVMVAAFDSVASTITSTGDVLKGLQSQMSGFDNLSFSTQYKIEAQIEKENKRRDDAFKLQKDLTEAQIAQMKAQTEAMLKGDGLIKIDGAGLAPHLEAFMWEVLKAIQIKVNKDGLKMLLGA